jgi:hypothetical protein
MEAMASGRPVIATAVDGTRELIDHGKTGWLVEAGNAKALADQIISVASDRAFASRVGLAAAHRMETEFSIEKMVSSFDRLYRELLSTSGALSRPSASQRKRAGKVRPVDCHKNEGVALAQGADALLSQNQSLADQGQRARVL